MHHWLVSRTQLISIAGVQVSKHIIGQSIFQLGVMYGLVAYGAPLFGVPEATSVQGPSQHYTIVFNAFVLMQLFNQVGMVLCSGVHPARVQLGLWNGVSIANHFSTACVASTFSML